MSKYTPRVTTGPDGIVAFIDIDGTPVIGQPHHPQAVNREPWATEEEALVWATEYAQVMAQQEQEAAAAEAAAIAEQEAAVAQIAEDRERLIRVEAMLAELLGRANNA